MSSRLVVAITGASGAIYGIRALEALQLIPEIETHLIISAGARTTIQHETGRRIDEVKNLADVVHSPGNLGASISSGSYRTLGMLVAPCSIKTLSAVANSYADNLISRAADVVLKEQRKLVLLVRETPMHLGHLRLMTQAAECGAVIMPPVPAFYQKPATLDDVVSHTIGRALDQFGIEPSFIRRWSDSSLQEPHDVAYDPLHENDPIKR